MPEPVPAPPNWIESFCRSDGILVDLETPGVGEFIRAGLADELIRVAVTDSGEILVLPSRLWDEAARRKDRKWLKSPRAPRRWDLGRNSR